MSAKKQRFAAQQRHKRGNQKALRLTLAKILGECLAPAGEHICISCFVRQSTKLMAMSVQVPLRMLTPVEPQCEWAKESSALPVAQKAEAKNGS